MFYPALKLISRNFFFSVLSFFTYTVVIAGNPSNGTTAFNSVSAGQKASGSGGGAGITASDVEGFNFRLTTTNATPTMVIEVWDGSVSSGNGVAFYEATSTVNPLISGIYITANSGAQFDLLSIGINAQSGSGSDASVTITGLDGSGNPISGATSSGTASVSALTNFDLSGITKFKGIRGIKITSASMVYAFIDNIQLQNVLLPTLPVSWIDFSATALNSSDVQLEWTTAAEQNNAVFSIEHSTNCRDWKTIGTQEGAGNSSALNYYHYTHKGTDEGINYYRIKQNDIDGDYSFSKIISITIKHINNTAVYPNPVLRNNPITIQLKNKGTVELYNSAGLLILQKNLSAGLHSVILPQLQAGLYQLKTNGEITTLVIQ